MINICEEYAKSYKIKFNGSKCNLLVFDKCKSDQVFNITVAGEPVQHVSSMKYLGHLLNSDRLDPHIENIKQDFVIKVNSFLGDFTNVSAAIKFDLFQSYCMSFYGSNICDLGNIECMYTEWRKAIRRI